jgi:pyridoxal 5'-phosphate synthase pdxS subunit
MRLINTSISTLDGMSEEEILRIAEHYANSYLKLLRTVKEEAGLDDEIRLDDVVFEEYTLGDIVDGIYKVLLEIKEIKRLPVVNFAAGGVATPADAAFMMQLGADGVFVGSGIFKSSNPAEFARAIVEAVHHFDEPEVIAEISKGIGEAMKGLDVFQLAEEEKLQTRGI